MRQSNIAIDLYGESTEFDEAEDLEYGETEVDAFKATEELDETEEMELASQLLEMTDEAQLDQFLGRIVMRANRAAGRSAQSGAGAGRALGGILKGVTKKTFPVLGNAKGGHVGGPSGSRVGNQLAANAGGFFGLELEGLSEEDQEFEVARRMMRFADTAAKNLASDPSDANPLHAANKAAIAAAKRHAPGMIRAVGPSAGASSGAVESGSCPNCGNACNGSDGQACPSCSKTQSGRWIRRGSHIILINAFGPTSNKSSK